LNSRRERHLGENIGPFHDRGRGCGYLLSIEDEDGGQLELTASPEQLDLIAEAIEEHLETDVEDIDEVKD
jgi:hypothetical protein